MTLTLREPFVPAWFQTLIWVTEMLPKGAVFTFFFFFFYFYLLKHFLCLYSGPVHGFGGDQYITLPESQKLLPLISTVGTDWWGSIVSPHLHLILLQIVFHAGEGELVSFSTMKKKITGQIAYVGGQKHPQHKACFLACSPSLWKSDAHLQIGKICSL